MPETRSERDEHLNPKPVHKRRRAASLLVSIRSRTVHNQRWGVGLGPLVGLVSLDYVQSRVRRIDVLARTMTARSSDS